MIKCNKNLKEALIPAIFENSLSLLPKIKWVIGHDLNSFCTIQDPQAYSHDIFLEKVSETNQDIEVLITNLKKFKYRTVTISSFTFPAVEHSNVSLANNIRIEELVLSIEADLYSLQLPNWAKSIMKSSAMIKRILIQCTIGNTSIQSRMQIFDFFDELLEIENRKLVWDFSFNFRCISGINNFGMAMKILGKIAEVQKIGKVTIRLGSF